MASSMYERSEIDIHPEFQRFYRWTDEQSLSRVFKRPIRTPFALARPFLTLSAIRSLSNCATAPRMVNIADPSGVWVSIDSVIDTNPTDNFLNSSMASARPLMFFSKSRKGQ